MSMTERGSEHIEEEPVDLGGRGSRGEHVHVGTVDRRANEANCFACAARQLHEQDVTRLLGCLGKRRAPQVDILEHEHTARIEHLAQRPGFRRILRPRGHAKEGKALKALLHVHAHDRKPELTDGRRHETVGVLPCGSAEQKRVEHGHAIDSVTRVQKRHELSLNFSSSCMPMPISRIEWMIES